MLKFSVVIPIYNEEASIKQLYFPLKDVMNRLGQSYEIIFANDASKDKSFEVLNSIKSKPSNLVVINLHKHSGKAVALQAGFDTAKGELIITMDGDLQNDPEDIPKLLNKMKDGYDAVCGWRHNRKDPWDKLLASKIANAVRKAITKENIHDVGCGLIVFKRTILKNIYLSRGLHRFLLLIISKLGYKIGEAKVHHHPRRFGKTKYNIRNRLCEGIIDLIRVSLCDIHRLMKRKSNYEIKEVIRK